MGINVVLPMAGRGKRFQEAGFKFPKPLIDVLGVPMYTWAIRSLPLELVNQVVFICLKEHLDNYGLKYDILKRFSNYKTVIIPVDKVTEGQAQTVLLAKDIINNQTPLVVFNADTYVVSQIRKVLLNIDVDGIIQVFPSSDPRYSYVKVNQEGYVIRTAEKKVISQYATTGMYIFKRGSDYIRYADKMIAMGIRSNNEFYVAPVCNFLIKDGKRIRITIAKEVHILGTPEELATFKKDRLTYFR